MEFNRIRSVTFTIVTLFTASFIKFLFETSVVSGVSSTCQTAVCQERAMYILKNMERNIKPCDNFYEFACGNFIKNVAIPTDKFMISQYDMTFSDMNAEVQNLIAEEIADNDLQIFKTVKRFYKICMNEELINKNSENDLKEMLTFLGGWPVLQFGDSWNKSNFHWPNQIVKIRQLGYNFDMLFSVDVDVDEKNNSRRLVIIDQPQFGVPSQYLKMGLDNNIVETYYKYMVDFAEMLGADRIKASEELKQVLEFEIELSKLNSQSGTDEFYNLMTVREVRAKYPYVKWLKLINRLLSPIVSIQATDTVNVAAPIYLNGLGQLLNQTSKRVLANYLIWRTAERSVVGLSSRFTELRSKALAVLTGTDKMVRSNYCRQVTVENLGTAVGALYARKHADEETKLAAFDLIHRVRESLRKIFNEMTWMDQNTKKAAIEKLSNLMSLVANPDEFYDDEILNKHFKNLEVHPESFLKTMLRVNKFLVDKKIQKLNKTVSKSDWTGPYGWYATSASAFYVPSYNAIFFPTAFMKGAVFNKSNPAFVNFAGMGIVAGHEITHGFDNNGRHFDKDGNRINWLQPETMQKYDERLQCFIEQYNNYRVAADVEMIGLATLGENVGDNGGVKGAYRAYERWLQENGDEQRLPGLEEFTSRQMFWLSYANLFCANYRPEFLRHILNIETHALNHLRIIGTLSNRPEFSRDFSCALGEKMNPVKKCSIW